jgi:hypothetical protein
MAEHSPAPWRSDDDNPLLILDGKGVAIAELVKPEIGSLSFSLYNRRVVIAAPELLAALKDAVDLADNLYGHLTSEESNLIDAWLAIIAKATGGENG